MTRLIMIWEPKCDARKPPKESVNLILSVNNLFHLSEKFRNCVDPDYLLKTIGLISNDAIERAYDWLIPAIYSYPQMIRRLPSSASCVLLLRAYGEEGIENNQLLELSSPLMEHVTACISGSNGESDCKTACEMICEDISSKEPDRRRCARRVLHEAIGKDVEDDAQSPTNHEELSWLFDLLKMEKFKILLKTVIPHLVSK